MFLLTLLWENSLLYLILLLLDLRARSSSLFLSVRRRRSKSLKRRDHAIKLQGREHSWRNGVLQYATYFVQILVIKVATMSTYELMIAGLGIRN